MKKYLLANPAIATLVRQHISADKNWPKNSDGAPAGFTLQQQIELFLKITVETIFTDAEPDQIVKLAQLFHAITNNSAARQDFEDMAILGKSAGGRKGLDIAALAAKYSTEPSA